jgi:hypothetical protein
MRRSALAILPIATADLCDEHEGELHVVPLEFTYSIASVPL